MPWSPPFIWASQGGGADQFGRVEPGFVYGGSAGNLRVGICERGHSGTLHEEADAVRVRGPAPVPVSRLLDRIGEVPPGLLEGMRHAVGEPLSGRQSLRPDHREVREAAPCPRNGAIGELACRVRRVLPPSSSYQHDRFRAGPLAAHREENPADDLMSALVHAEVDGERLTHAEIAAFFVLLSVAGNDTTRHTTSHAMRALSAYPEQRALVMEDLDGRLAVAVEEFVRWASPVLSFRRTTTREVELHGERLRPGEKVVLFYHSANRDEQAFADPWRFDVTRDPNRHLGFGGGGPHYCLGASLARTQLRSIFGELLRQIPDIEASEPELLRSAFIHGVKRMRCSFRARA